MTDILSLGVICGFVQTKGLTYTLDAFLIP